MRTRMWCVALSALCVGTAASGQTVLSEAEALARLSADSPRVRAIRSAVDLARADVLGAARWPNPRVTYNRESVAGVTENMVTVTQPLPISGRRGFEISAATALVGASASRADEAIRQARTELRTAYADLQAAQTREAELSTSRERLQGLADVLGRREAAGESAGYDRLRAEREVIDLEGALSSARAERARAQGAVAAFFADAGAVAAIVAAPTPRAPRSSLPEVADLVANAEQTRGDWAALRQEIEAARFAERAADRRRVPEPEVVAGTKSSSAAGGDVGSVVSVHVGIPLFDRGHPERATARARRAQAENRVEAFRAAVRAQIAAARTAVLERRGAADRYRAATADIDRLERIAQVSYDAGERGILELLDAYRSGSAARERQAELDAAARRAELELEFLSGWEIR